MSLSHQQQLEAMMRAAMRGEHVVLTAPTLADAKKTFDAAKRFVEQMDDPKRPSA